MDREKQRILLIAIIAGSLVGSLLIVLYNQESGMRIRYYQTPRGILERALNRSADREYNETLLLHNTRLAIGLILMLVFIGGLGLYRTRNPGKPVELI